MNKLKPAPEVLYNLAKFRSGLTVNYAYYCSVIFLSLERELIPVIMLLLVRFRKLKLFNNNFFLLFRM